MPNSIEYIDTLLAKHFAEEPLSFPEQEVLKSWKDENRVSYEKLSKVLSSEQSEKRELSVNVDAAWQKVLLKKNTKHTPLAQKKNTLFFWAGIAASLLLVLGVLNWLFIENNQYVQLSNASNTVKEFSLPDGSNISLNVNSSLEYNKDMSAERNVKLLVGEAFFDVRPDAAHPFKISANLAQIEVLGTSFAVKMKESATEVYVKTGRVSVSEKEAKIILKPGEKGIIEEGKLSQEIIKNTNYLAWKERILRFKDASLKNAIPQLESYYHIKINTPQNYEDCFFTTTFTTETLQEVLEELQLLLNFKYKIEGKEVTLYNIKCK